MMRRQSSRSHGAVKSFVLLMYLAIGMVNAKTLSGLMWGQSMLPRKVSFVSGARDPATSLQRSTGALALRCLHEPDFSSSLPPSNMIPPSRSRLGLSPARHEAYRRLARNWTIIPRATVFSSKPLIHFHFLWASYSQYCFVLSAFFSLEIYMSDFLKRHLFLSSVIVFSFTFSELNFTFSLGYAKNHSARIKLYTGDSI